MENMQFLDVSENRVAVRTISQRVLAEVEPDEVEVSAGLIEPLIDVAARGEVVTVDTSDEAGSFGGADLIVMVVVPVVVTALGELLARLGERRIDELKKKLAHEKEARAFIEITVDDIEVVVRRIKSPGSKQKIKKLTAAVNAALLEYLAS